ncbi:L-fuculose kinase [Janthinobacterium sp. GW460P]|uniref:FGGY-family carbohydrate kinase n=1 Tax=unclassified Janthinobacterium TaxID=2610881 RepID=UPI000A31E86A|nr:MULTISPECIES: FGGY family carbohydrate kinase [unclassified Janthinobacterium]MCC7703562.1 L-fuculose kinase [Janthinobacterium sp. GW460P]MCC7709069.1 L-fuculose kinase [Janthinobacterium sp. GW460W]
MTDNATVVLDIGKTNAKLTLLDATGAILAEQRCPNSIVHAGLYPHHDTERLWDWLQTILAVFARQARITAIVPVTHGATAALVDDDGLVLPILDYESSLPQALAAEYAALRPAFADSLSPRLPCGLNLGLQLYWLAKTYPEQFARACHILTYPQYWAWRLSGVAAGEVTSLGCHTDLWQPRQGTYSSLVQQMEWTHLFPPLRPAWTALGPVLAHALPPACQVLCGIHDSNASLLRYLDARAIGEPRTVLSTGTWAIAAAFGAPLEQLDETADMLANVNALGQPVACMRFMGGREFSVLAGEQPQACDAADIARLVGQGTLALPCFAESGGPFVGQAGRIAGPAPRNAQERYALATLYCALMSDYCLDALGARGPVTVEGSFTDNRHFSSLLAALRPGQDVSVSQDASGTTCGGWMLHRWGEVPTMAATLMPALAVDGLLAYREQWRALLTQ